MSGAGIFVKTSRGLNAGQKALLIQCAQGKTYRQIAMQDGVTDDAVAARMHYLRQKYGAQNNVHLITIALVTGEISLCDVGEVAA